MLGRVTDYTGAMTRPARTAAWAALGLAALVFGACARDAGAPRHPPAPIRTDRDRYLLRPGRFGHETTIVVRFTAPRDTTVHILHCNGAISWGLQRLEEGRWANAWVATTNGCLSAPLVVPAGGVYADTLSAVSRTDVPRPGPIQEEIQPGTYRVVLYQVLTSFDPWARPMGDELSLERRVSGPITIERAP